MSRDDRDLIIRSEAHNEELIISIARSQKILRTYTGYVPLDDRIDDAMGLREEINRMYQSNYFAAKVEYCEKHGCSEPPPDFEETFRAGWGRCVGCVSRVLTDDVLKF